MRIWLNAARPRTLPAAIAPVLVGTAAAIYVAGDLPRLGVFLAALAASVMIQIGTNPANDYSTPGAAPTRLIDSARCGSHRPG